MSPPNPLERQRSNVPLIISLSANLVLAGIIGVALFRLAMHPPMLPPHNGMGWQGNNGHPPVGMVERQQVRQMMAPRLLQRVAPDKADALHALSKARKADIDGLRNSTIEARREVIRLYSADELDRPAFEKAMARMQVADAALEIALVKATVETSVILSAEQRRAVIAWQPKRGPHGEILRGDGPPPPDGPRGDGPPRNNH